MIFLTLGTQAFQFNRLIQAVDELVEAGIIKDEVSAQTGHSTYKPKNYTAEPFMSYDEFNRLITECDILITHGGASTLVESVKNGKTVIAMPRKKCFNEHVDDHQHEIIDEFTERGYILSVSEPEELANALTTAETFTPKPFEDSGSRVQELLNEFINNLYS